jgi:hypothetical protein
MGRLVGGTSNIVFIQCLEPVLPVGFGYVTPQLHMHNLVGLLASRGVC